jgi:hypothetical protein
MFWRLASVRGVDRGHSGRDTTEAEVDRDLVDQARRGDREAFAVLSRSCSTPGRSETISPFD